MSHPFDNTRMGEVFTQLESRQPRPGSPEYAEDILQAQRIVAAAYFIDILSTAIVSVPREKRHEILAPTMERYLSFLAIISPAMFDTPEASQKTKAAISMALKDMRDLAAKRVQQ